LVKRLEEAKGYAESSSGFSVEQYLYLIEEWKSMKLSVIQTAWTLVQENLIRNTIIEEHAKAARIAFKVLHDKESAMKIMQQAAELAENNHFESYVSAMIELADFYADPNYGPDKCYADTVFSFIDKAIAKASINDEYDLIAIVKWFGNRSKDGWGDEQMAVKAIDLVSKRIIDAKLKKKISTKAKKVLADYLS
jgi:hypothetical protein